MGANWLSGLNVTYQPDHRRYVELPEGARGGESDDVT